MTGVEIVGVPPTAAQARKWLRLRRSSRRSVARRVTDIADALLYVGMVVGLAIGAASAGLERADHGNTSAGTAELDLMRWVVALAVVLVVAAAFKALLSFGPVLVRAAAQAWLLSSPIDRRSLLRNRLGALVIIGALSGGALAIVTLIGTGWPAAGRPWWLIAGGAFGVLEVSSAVLLQSRLRRIRGAQQALNLIMAAVVVAAATILLAGPGRAPSLPRTDTADVPLVIGLLVITGLATWWAHHRLAVLTRASVSTGVELAVTTAVATTFLDPTVLSSTLLIRRTRAIARVRSARIRGTRTIALLRADWTRVRRLWLGPAVWAALLPVPYVVAMTVPAILVPGAHLIAAFLATDRLAGGLRLVCRSPAIRRALGGDDWQLRLVHLAIPGLGALLWSALTAAAIPTMPITTAAVSALGAVAVCYRIATRPPMEYSSPMMDLGFGAIPIGLVLQLIRGPALLFVLAWVQILIVG